MWRRTATSWRPRPRRAQAAGEEEGGEAGIEDEDMQDADAGQEEEED